VRTRRVEGGGSANYFDVAIIGATGLAKTDRP
jgi:hypothetical protein